MAISTVGVESEGAQVEGTGWAARPLQPVAARCFAVLAALAMVVLAFAPLSRAEEDGGVSPVATDSSIDDVPDADSSDGDADSSNATDEPGPPLGPTDSPGGPSPPPGQVQSVYSPAPPAVSELPRERIAPHLQVTGSEYRYTTVVGVYAFPKTLPFVARHTSGSNDTLVLGSTFVVIAPGVAPFREPEVLNATDYEYAVRYSLAKGAKTVGNVTITWDFRDDAPPKATAELKQSKGGASLGLSWLSLTLDTVAFNGTRTVDFGSLDPPTRIGTPENRLLVGPGSDRSSWGRRVLLNWSDADNGEAYAGRFSVGGLQGAAILVKWPEGRTLVDPVVVADSAPWNATDFSIQRKTFAYGGRYWAFWYDGSGIAYANSRDGVSWSGKMSAPSGPIAYGFDVDQRDGTVLIGYAGGNKTSIVGLKGSISGSQIAWSVPYPVDWWTSEGAGPATVAIGTDGHFWFAIPRKGGWCFQSACFHVWLSTAAWGFSFPLRLPVLFGSLDGNPSDSVARVLALSNGGTYVIVATKYHSNFLTYRLTPTGWRQVDHPAYSLSTTEDRGHILSAAALPDDRVRIVYRHSSGALWTIRLETDDINSWAASLDGRSSYFPTVSVDVNGESHVLYQYIEDGHYYVGYTRQRPINGSGSESWMAPVDAFAGTIAERRSYTSIPLSTDRVALIWTEGNTSYSVKFGSLPTPMDFGSQTGDPWNRQGISPYQSYFKQLSELVSPGSGLLTVKQTDLAVPGRGLNLDVSRVFLTPRAFSDLDGNAPAVALFEDYPAADLGKGWALNFPWLSDQYVHLWDGQMYVVRWQGDRFENHDGEHFLIVRSAVPGGYNFTLHAKNGVRYEFNAAKQLTAIRDPSGNQILFGYASGKLTLITDTIGRTVSLGYNEDGTLKSVTYGTRVTTYGYETVGSCRMLTSVVDPIGRVTRFEYTDPRSPYLLTAVTYPTGAESVYHWSNPAVTVGSDFHAYYVTNQSTLNATGQSIRGNVYNYTVVNGRVTYVNVSTYDRGILKGFTLQQFDSVARRSTTVRWDATGPTPVRTGKEVSWYDSAGGVGQVDVYPGASLAPAYSTVTASDEWGNVIYSRDATGHEKFSSFANTRHQGGFEAPGQLTRTASGLVLSNDFDDRDLTLWAKDGLVSLEYGAFSSLPPVLNLTATSATTSSSASHLFDAQIFGFWFETVVRPQEKTRDHHVRIRSWSDTQVDIRFAETGNISRMTGPDTWAVVAPYSATQWYRVTLFIDPYEDTYDLYLDGTPKVSGAALLGSGASVQIEFEAESCPSCGASTLYVDSVSVWRNNTLTITGLAAGQFVKYYDSVGRLRGTWRSSGGNSLSFTFPGGSDALPLGTIVVLDTEWNAELSSPTHVFWGGDTWDYTCPWRSMALTRTRSGFYGYNTVFLDDSGYPPATYVNDTDIWDWGPYDFPVLGAESHRSKLLYKDHQHYFEDSGVSTIPSAGTYHMQYVYIPENERPSEIMLQFQDASGSGDEWAHRAFWGADLIPWGTWAVGGTDSHRPMGGLPAASGRWILLTVETDDVGTDGVEVQGLAYTLYGGTATWDVSAFGLNDTGYVTVTGLPPGWTAEVFVADSIPWQIAEGMANASGTARAFVYGYDFNYDGGGPPRAYPFDGYVLIKNSTGDPMYRSPALPLSGGDVYAYTATNDYPNTEIGPWDTVSGRTMHDRLVASLEYQTGRGASPGVPQETRIRYESRGLPDRQRVRNGSTWYEGSMAYDEPAYAYGSTSGLLTSVTDPLGNVTHYSYSPTYSGAYTTQVEDGLGFKTRATYDPATGLQLSGMNARGYRTRQEYDIVGRSVAGSSWGLSTASEVLYWDMEWKTEEDTPRMEDLSGHGNDGDMTGTRMAAGEVGLGAEFITSSDSVSAPDSSSLSLTSSFTLSAWVKYDSLPGTDYAEVARKYDPGDCGFILDVVTTGVDAKKLRLVIGEGWPSGYLSNRTLTDPGRWYHVSAAFDDVANTVTLYIDGVPSGTHTNVVVAPVDNSWPLSVGKDPDSLSRTWDGVIDEVRVFNLTLTAAEIAALHANSYGLLSSSRAAFDDGANVGTQYDPTTQPRLLHLDMATVLDGRIEDLAGTGLHATPTGTAPVQGIVGGAREFNGAGDFLAVPSSLAVNLTGTTTVAFWIRHNYSGTPSDSKGIFFKGTNTGLGQRNYAGWLDTSRRLVMGWGDASTNDQVQGTTALTDTNRWYHVAMAFDWSGDSFRIYLNGVLDGQGTSVVNTVANSGKLVLGKMSENSLSTQFLDGKLDEFQVFDRALAPAEIQDLMRSMEKGFYAKQYFDSLGRPTRSLRRDLFGNVTSVELEAYNFQDKVISQTSPRSAVTTYEYDFLGRPTKVTSPNATNPLTVSYDDVNRVQTITAENGRKVQYLSDLAGRTTAVREYSSPTSYYTTTYEYDEVGNLLNVANALLKSTTHEYDALNRLTRTTYPDATKVETYAYDAVGNLKTRTDRSGNTTTYLYDDLYRLKTIDYPGFEEDVNFTYDADGNPLAVTNSVSAVSYLYDGLDRVLNETNLIGTPYVVGYEYDPAGRVTRLTYPDFTSATYTYDAVGRTLQVRTGATPHATFSHYADDLIRNVTLGNQIIQSYSYNGRGWPTSIKATYGSTTYMDLGYTYDDSGNVLTMGTEAFTYDKLDRLWNATGGYGTRSYSYDAVGNRQSEQGSVLSADLRPNANGDFQEWSQFPVTGSHFDKVDDETPDGDATYVYARAPVGKRDLYQISDLGTSLGGATIDYVKVSAVARYVGTNPWDGGTLQLLVKTHGTLYNAGGGFVLTSGYATVSWTLPQNPFTGQPWTLAEVNALQVGVLLVSTSNEVRVTQVYATVHATGSTTYAYDPLGMNELTSMTRFGAMTSFDYDANGNLLRRTGGGPTWNYSWNHDNLMTWASKDGSRQQRYLYDGLGRRVKAEGTSPSTWIVSIFSGGNPVFEKKESGATTKYVYAAGLRVARIDFTGINPPSCASSYYLADALGSTRKVLSSSVPPAAPSVLFSAEYEPFGAPYGATGSETFRFTGETHDDPTGLVYLRARQYDPDLGRFVGADPVLGSLAAPQTQNRYAYAINNPTKHTDPTGQFLNIIIGAVAGFIIGGVGCWLLGGSDCLKAALIGGAVGAFAGATFGLGMAAFGVGTAAEVAAGSASIVAGSWAAFGAGVAVGMAVGAQTYFFASVLGMATGQMSARDLSMRDFAVSVGLGALFGGPGGKSYNPRTYWRLQTTFHNTPEGEPISPHARWRMWQKQITPENVDEAIGSGAHYFDPKPENLSIVSAKGIGEMTSPVNPQVEGKFIQVAQTPNNGVIKTAYWSWNIPSRYEPL